MVLPELLLLIPHPEEATTCDIH